MPSRPSRRHAGAVQRGGAIGAAPIIVAAVAIVMVACTGDDDAIVPTTSVAPTTTTTAPRPDDGVLSIGALLPRTGQGAPLGEAMLTAIEQAVEQINDAGGVLGEPVRLHVADESVDTGLDELLSAGVDAIVGPASSLVALAQLEAAMQPATGVVTCSPSAAALALDDYPDNNYFFRTIPSDSLQMTAIARRAERTGQSTIAIGHLDDPFGRGLADALSGELSNEVVTQVGFGSDEGDLSDVARELLADEPGVVVVLGDADDGSRLLAALDSAVTELGALPSQVLVNDAIRSARQTIQGLTPEFRELIVGIAPSSRSVRSDGPSGPFAAHAWDCVNLIALAAVRVDSDAPSRIRSALPAVSVGGRVCITFAECAGRLEQGLQIDYNGASGSVELSNATGDPVRAWFEAFAFNDEGVDVPATVEPLFEVSD